MSARAQFFRRRGAADGDSLRVMARPPITYLFSPGIASGEPYQELLLTREAILASQLSCRNADLVIFAAAHECQQFQHPCPIG